MAITIEQLLATLAIDSAEATVVSDRMVVIQRDPQPNEKNIAIDTTIKFLVVDLDADPDAPRVSPTFTVSVNGSNAGVYSGGTFTVIAPWNGSVLETLVTEPFVGWYVELQQPVVPIFSSEELVTLKIEIGVDYGYGYGPWGHYPYGTSEDPGPSVDIEYSFTIEDLSKPKLLSAEAIDLFTIRLTFDDMMQTEGTGPDSILSTINWADAITTLNADPDVGICLEIVSIVEVVGSYGKQFDMTTNWEMTQGCLYQVDVSLFIENANDNTMDPEGNTAQFYGYIIDTVPGRRFDYWHMMVPMKNRQEDKTQDLKRLTNCIVEVLGLLLYDVDHFTDQFDIELATDAQIDLMLSDMGNPFDWADLVLTAEQRRKLLRFLVEIYKLKGTEPGIEDTVFFLLGEEVTVVDNTTDGWVLGVDELGDGSIAHVLNDAGETYDFSTEKKLLLMIDSIPLVQEITFQTADFADPANGLAEEVVAVIVSQIINGGAYVAGSGTAAKYTSPASPFTVAAGETLEIEIDDSAYSFTFRESDFAQTGIATVEEIVARLEKELKDVSITIEEYKFIIRTLLRGTGAKIKFTGGTALPGLGITVNTLAEGNDAKCVSIYSETVGTDAAVQIMNSDANDVLQYGTDSVSGTGGAILAPTDSYTLYSFDIETENQLDEETIAIIRKIAEYMKPGHTHLINIRPALPLPWNDEWVLGVDKLDETAILAE